MSQHLLHNQKPSVQIKTLILPKPKHHDCIVQNYPQLSILTRTFQHNYLTFWKCCVDFSSNKPDNLTNSVRTIESMLIFPITINLGFWINFSICSRNNMKGYCIPAFQLGALSNALMKSALPPAQQIMVGSNDRAVNTWEHSNTQLFTAGTSRPQWAMVRVTNSVPSQKQLLSPRRTLVVVNSNEYTFSRCKMVTTCFIKQTKQWWRKAWNKHIWSKQAHNIHLMPNQNKMMGKQ